MAEENQDNILEEETAQDDAQTEEEAPKKGLSTSLLIKVAIGLGVLLVALIAAFFLLSGTPEPETETTEDTEISESVIEETTEEIVEEEPASVTPEKGTIELPSVAAESTPPADTTTPSTADSSAASTTAPITPTTAAAPAGDSPKDKVLSEMVALQKQLSAMQQENQKLIKRVEQLTKESETLRGRLPQSTPSTASPINDEQVLNTDEVPLYYRENRYSNTPQPELKPQWGEFQQAK